MGDRSVDPILLYFTCTFSPEARVPGLNICPTVVCFGSAKESPPHPMCDWVPAVVAARAFWWWRGCPGPVGRMHSISTLYSNNLPDRSCPVDFGGNSPKFSRSMFGRSCLMVISGGCARKISMMPFFLFRNLSKNDNKNNNLCCSKLLKHYLTNFFTPWREFRPRRWLVFSFKETSVHP